MRMTSEPAISRTNNHTHKPHLPHILDVFLENRLEEWEEIQELGVVQVAIPGLDSHTIIFLQTIAFRVCVDDDDVAQVPVQIRQVLVSALGVLVKKRILEVSALVQSSMC